MNWKDVEALLMTQVVQQMNDPARGKAWLSDLRTAPDGERLAICLAIDIASGSLLAETIARTLDELPNTHTDAREAFGGAARRADPANNLVCSSALQCPPPTPPDTYIRILTGRDFVKYYAAPALALVVDDDDITHVLKTIFVDRVTSLNVISNWWSGANDVVWVTAHQDLVSTIDDTHHIPGTLLNDRLGLGKRPVAGASEVLVAIVYPANSSTLIRVRQPTTFDASWLVPGWYYLSAAEGDGWGRTQSCSGSLPPFRERVHGKFKGLTAAFEPLYIGELQAVVMAPNALISEGYARLGRVAPPLPTS